MEILSQTSSYFTNNMNWQQQAKWTQEENKLFENALAVYDKDTPDRWHKVAIMIPGKTAEDVVRQYQALEADVSDIEAGLVPIPGYSTRNTTDNDSHFTFELMNCNVNITSSCYDQDGFQHFSGFIGNRSNSITGSRGSDQERKKGVAWTEDEHKLFLMGLKKYGKGDWRNISRNFVTTRTPTQVASHAQKYYIRQVSGGKDKRRASIHDITTVHLSDDTRTPSPEGNKTSHSSPDESPLMTQNHHHAHYDQWTQAAPTTSVSTLSFNGIQEPNLFMSMPYGAEPFATNMQRGAAYHDPYNGAPTIGFQM